MPATLSSQDMDIALEQHQKASEKQYNTDHNTPRIVFCLFVKVSKGRMKKEKFTKILVLETILKAYQQSDPSTSIIVHQSVHSAKQTYTSISLFEKNKSIYLKIKSR
jgi:hypothetical protein